MPKVTQEHLDARRAQILDGARRAFAEHGYDGATVEEARGGDRALARRDLPLLREQERPVRRARDGDEHALRRHPPRVRPRRGVSRVEQGEPGVAGRPHRDREPDAPRRGLRPAVRGEVRRRQPPHPGVVQAAAGRGEASRRRLMARSSGGSRPPSSTASRSASPAATRSTSSRCCASSTTRSPRRESRKR